MSKPLENIRIPELTRVLAGPIYTMLLSDLRANIVQAIDNDSRRSIFCQAVERTDLEELASEGVI